VSRIREKTKRRRNQQRSRVTIRKRDTNKGVEPPPALSFPERGNNRGSHHHHRLHFLQNQGTSRGSQHNHRLFLLQTHEASRVGQHNHRPPFSKTRSVSLPFSASAKNDACHCAKVI